MLKHYSPHFREVEKQEVVVAIRWFKSDWTGRTKVAKLSESQATYLRWIEKTTSLTARSTRDVLSRTKRVDRLIGIDRAVSESRLIQNLEEHPEFVNCSQTVKSQLRSAVRLYCRFIGK